MVMHHFENAQIHTQTADNFSCSVHYSVYSMKFFAMRGHLMAKQNAYKTIKCTYWQGFHKVFNNLNLLELVADLQSFQKNWKSIPE